MNEIFVILCEEIRNEVGGSQSIIGIFPNQTLKAKLPTILPKFGVFLFIVKLLINQKFHLLLRLLTLNKRRLPNLKAMNMTLVQKIMVAT